MGVIERKHAAGCVVSSQFGFQLLAMATVFDLSREQAGKRTEKFSAGPVGVGDAMRLGCVGLQFAFSFDCTKRALMTL